jgi:hypothetical protein
MMHALNINVAACIFKHIIYNTEHITQRERAKKEVRKLCNESVYAKKKK